MYSQQTRMKRLSERSLLFLLAAVQFTHIVDFMILMPLGPQLMRDLRIGPGTLSSLVAAYTVSSGIFGLLAAPFIDRFDRRKLLLFAYGGFIFGTLSCGLESSVSGKSGSAARIAGPASSAARDSAYGRKFFMGGKSGRKLTNDGITPPARA